MDVVDEFVKAWMKDHKRMDWKKCINEGCANGHYKNYKDARTLSITIKQSQSWKKEHREKEHWNEESRKSFYSMSNLNKLKLIVQLHTKE